jgi:phosphoglycolate phosphatase
MNDFNSLNFKLKYPAVIFDLDGTLADTLKDLADATNWALAQFNLPPHPLESYRYLVGEGRTQLCRKALPPDRQDLTDEIARLMTEYYGKHCFDYTRPYPGIVAMLTKLSALGVKLTVLSNKPQNFVELTMKKLFGEFHFEVVLGDKPDLPRKPDPAGAILIAQQLELAPEKIAYVGDTSTDMQTATRAGMPAVGVSWGFRDRKELLEHGAKIIVDTPEELFKIW